MLNVRVRVVHGRISIFSWPLLVWYPLARRFVLFSTLLLTYLLGAVSCSASFYVRRLLHHVLSIHLIVLCASKGSF